MALRDARQTTTELALSALPMLRGSSQSFYLRDAATAAAADAGLSPSDDAGDLYNTAYDRKLIIQLFAVRNGYVDKRGRPGLKTRYAAERHDALRESEGEKP